MFYSNNDGYMQDLYFYNQIPTNTYMNTFPNGMSANQNIQMMPNNIPINNPGMQNLNSLYPSIYRIVNPVVSRVVSNSNQPINENLLNNMTDTIYNIVEGQVDLGGDDQVQRNSASIETSAQTSTGANQSVNTRNTESRNQPINNQTNFRNTRNESLLRDLIKILIIKELLSRNQLQRQFYQNPYYNSQPFFMNM